MEKKIMRTHNFTRKGGKFFAPTFTAIINGDDSSGGIL